MNSYATAQEAYVESSVLTAPPERLVVMLYDAALRFLAHGAGALRDNDLERSRARLARADAILDELNVSLDMSAGEVAERLRTIYLFCKRHLADATIHRDAERVEQVAGLLSELREAWDAVASGGEA